MIPFPFAKYHGAGNDFVIIDARLSPLPNDLPGLAKQLCARRWGIGADGLILLLTSDRADYRMRIFNADGSEPTMCGNGIRCLYDFTQQFPKDISIETGAGVIACRGMEDQIVVNLGIPEVLHWPALLPQGDAFVVNTGVPHAVLFVDDIASVPVNELGRQIRHHPLFSPEGVNVNFTAVQADGQITVRTYERGVEGETASCGTGAAAAAFAAMLHYRLSSPINVLTRCTFEEFTTQPYARFQFPTNANRKQEVEMLGMACRVFDGVYTT